MPMATVQRQAAADGAPRELRHADERTEDRLRDLGAAMMPLQRLRRTGAGPMLFNGRTIATMSGVTPALPFWYEINLHRSVIGTVLTDVRLFHKASGLADLFRVAEHDDLDAAVAHLESYAAARDAVVPQQVMQAASSADLAIAVAQLQLHVDQLCGHFAAVLGELLYALTPAE